MNKAEFLSELRNRLNGLHKDDIKRSLDYYSEMIDDRMDEGMAEEEAVADLGKMDDIVSQILSDTSFVKLVIEKVKPKRKAEGWVIALLIIGSPIWASLLISLFAVVISVYLSVWSVIVSMYAVTLSLFLSGLAGIAAGCIFFTKGDIIQGILFIGAALILTGLSVLVFFAVNYIVKQFIILTKKFFLWLKSLFIKKRRTK